MKKKFDTYLQKVCDYYGITKTELLTIKSKVLPSEARYLLYFILSRNGFRNHQIMAYMAKNGYELHRSDITRGIYKWQDNVLNDDDLLQDVKNLELI